MFTNLSRLRREGGSATLEACISLMTLVIGIAFVYSLVKVVVAESIMQHAVDNMAMEVSSYLYIADKTGLVTHTDPDADPTNADKMANEVYNIGNDVQKMTDFSELIGVLNKDDSAPVSFSEIKDAGVNTAKNIKDAGSAMMSSIQCIISIAQTADWSKELRENGYNTVEAGVTLGVDAMMEYFYLWKLDSYLPCDRETFCKQYFIEEDSITFNYSRVFPGTSNNTILVAVEYKTTSPFSMFPIQRTIIRQAYTAAWLVDPANGKLPE